MMTEAHVYNMRFEDATDALQKGNALHILNVTEIFWSSSESNSRPSTSRRPTGLGWIEAAQLVSESTGDYGSARKGI